MVQAEAGTAGAAERGTVVIVARNNLHLTRKTIASAHMQDYRLSLGHGLEEYRSVDILLVDNASRDGTVQWAATKDYISLIAFQEQRSLAACWNYALSQVFKRSSHALVLNNDVEIRPETYRYLAGYSMNAHGCGIELNGKTDGPKFVTCVSVNTDEQFKEPALGWSYHVREHPDYSCFLIRKECFEQVPFDERYFPAYCEDSDHHVRMHRAGIRAVCIDLPFLHHGAGTIKHADPVERRKIEKGAQANRERFKKEYGCLPGTKEYELLFA